VINQNDFVHDGDDDDEEDVKVPVVTLKEAKFFTTEQ